MFVQTACEALRSGHVLELQYDGYVRLVEVHAVGFAGEDSPIMRAWQIRGGADNKAASPEAVSARQMSRCPGTSAR